MDCLRGWKDCLRGWMDWVRGAAYEPKITQMGTISDHDRISGRHFELGVGNKQGKMPGTYPQILDAIA